MHPMRWNLRFLCVLLSRIVVRRDLVFIPSIPTASVPSGSTKLSQTPNPTTQGLRVLRA
jgi:hypothetical protein